MRIGFLVWNEFQFYHFRSILAALPEAILFVDVRAGLNRRFPFDVLKGIANPVVRLSKSQLEPISVLVDILVVQSNTQAKATLPGVKIVAVQYSLSKEWHQYGQWMKEADLVLCFGDYSRDRIASSGPIVPVGNPRMDDYFADRLDERLLERIRRKLDPAKPTLMLAPSWNDPQLTSQLKAGRKALSQHYNILWSPHHNTRIFGRGFIDFLTRNLVTYDRYLYYLKLADILVSDTSGSLFDAVHAHKPVIIADFGTTNIESRESIEFQMRDSIGPVALSCEEIAVQANRLIVGDLNFTQRNAELRKMCFCCDGNAAAKIAETIRSAFPSDCSNDR